VKRVRLLIGALLVLVMLGGTIGTTLAETTSTKIPAKTLSKYTHDILDRYNGIGKEFIKKVGPGKYTIVFNDSVNETERKRIIDSVDRYIKEQFYGDIAKKKGIPVSPSRLFINNIQKKKTELPADLKVVSPYNSPGDVCYYVPQDDKTYCVGDDWAEKSFAGSTAAGSTYFKVTCNGFGFKECTLEGVAGGYWKGSGVVDLIKLTTTVKLSGIWPSISWPPQFTPITNTVGQMVDEFPNNSSGISIYTNLKASDWFGFWRFEQDTDSNLKKGNTAIHIFTQVYFQ